MQPRLHDPTFIRGPARAATSVNRRSIAAHYNGTPKSETPLLLPPHPHIPCHWALIPPQIVQSAGLISFFPNLPPVVILVFLAQLVQGLCVGQFDVEERLPLPEILQTCLAILDRLPQAGDDLVVPAGFCFQQIQE